jgi:hypothetical protein
MRSSFVVAAGGASLIRCTDVVAAVERRDVRHTGEVAMHPGPHSVDLGMAGSSQMEPRAAKAAPTALPFCTCDALIKPIGRQAKQNE